LLVNALSDDN